MLKLKITMKKDTPDGVWNGGVVFHAETTTWNVPVELVGRGCVLGRGDSPHAAAYDFVRRARLDGGSIEYEGVELALFESQLTAAEELGRKK